MNKLRFLLITFSCCLGLEIQQAGATGQVGEIIIIDGQKRQMLASPIEYNHKLSSALSKYLPADQFCTGCWRGYIGEWEIRDNILYLNRILNFETRKAINFHRTFNAYKVKGKTKTSWFSGEIRVTRGAMVKYYHGGFQRYFEHETVYTIEKGQIIGEYTYHNTLKKANWKRREIEQQIINRFNLQKFPELKKADVNIGISIMPTEEGQFDSLTLVSFQVKTPTSHRNIRNKEHPYIQELIQVLKQFPNWDTAIVKDKIHSTDLYYFTLWQGLPEKKNILPPIEIIYK